MHYQHTQPAKTLLWILLPVTGCLAIYALTVSHLATAIVLVPLLILAWLFSSLTIEVDDKQLRWFFGPGFWKKSLPLEQLHSAGPVTNKWWYGLGIRLTPSGWLYNVSGLTAVELHLKDGRKIRLGTDQPHTLVDVLQQHESRAFNKGKA
ncbi:hypothetical protein [Lacimicrobium alkaliphilum]|uniref:Bacterial Pleckstrin homology domain-containing protein n=1 Tax=Lacimicrobium alkaliphilum TaxID=1526571 RepID=A0A0U3BAJ3_9ALTE|nr:hypothetical protein [Lacimicrobium alkaliphilum]ALS98677.1 hypothetical protein AT746_10625 [Lacimicrobium alkaliphilum]